MDSDFTNLLQKLKIEGNLITNPCLILQDNELSGADVHTLVEHLNTTFANKQDSETNSLLQTIGDLARDCTLISTNPYSPFS
jgi:ABC-type phosphonate transport system ATPase subunit